MKIEIKMVDSESNNNDEDLIPTQPLEGSNSNLEIPFVPRTDFAWGYLETQAFPFISREIREIDE